MSGLRRAIGDLRPRRRLGRGKLLPSAGRAWAGGSPGNRAAPRNRGNQKQSPRRPGRRRGDPLFVGEVPGGGASPERSGVRVSTSHVSDVCRGWSVTVSIVSTVPCGNAGYPKAPTAAPGIDDGGDLNAGQS